MEEFRVNIKNLIDNKLTLEQYFILYCVNFRQIKTVVDYVKSTDLFPASTFKSLEQKGFLVVEDYKNITFDVISLTDKAVSLFSQNNLSQSFLTAFNEFKEVYPSKVPTTNGGIRRLHQDQNRCKKLYKETIVDSDGRINELLHENIKKAVKLYFAEKSRANELAFTQLMATFLQQKTWEQYLDDVNNNVEPLQERRNYDVI